MKKLMAIMAVAIIVAAGPASAAVLYISGDAGYATYDTGTNTYARLAQGNYNQGRAIAYDENIDLINVGNSGGLGVPSGQQGPSDGSVISSIPGYPNTNQYAIWQITHDRVNGDIYYHGWGHSSSGDVFVRPAGNAANNVVSAGWTQVANRGMAYNGTTNTGYLADGSTIRDHNGTTVISGLPTNVQNIECDWVNNNLYMVEAGGDNRLYMVDLDNIPGGAIELHDSNAGGGQAGTGIAVDPGGNAVYYGFAKVWGTSDQIWQVELDGSNPTLLFEGSAGGAIPGFVGIFGMDVVPTTAEVVPEPAGLGLVGLALLAVRKRRS